VEGSATPPNITGTPTEAASSAPVETVTDATRTAADGAAESVLMAPPGALFFAGGVVVIAVATAWWYRSRYRPMYTA
jgi:hypothetical protein